MKETDMQTCDTYVEDMLELKRQRDEIKKLKGELNDLQDRNAQLEAKIRLIQDHEKAWKYGKAVKKGTQ